MSAVAVAIGVSALVGAAASSSAANSAANAETNAANQANSTLQSQYNQTRQDNMPWLQSGQNALNQLNQQMPNLTRSFSLADFQQDPGYQFNLQQGQQAIERSAAARGLLDSTGTLKNLDSYTQGLASNEYQNAYNRYNQNQSNTFNRLAQMAGVGQQAAAQNQQAGAATAQGVANNLTGAGNATAAANIAQGNNITSLLNNGANTWAGYQAQQRGGGAGSYVNPVAGWQPTQLQAPTLGGGYP